MLSSMFPKVSLVKAPVPLALVPSKILNVDKMGAEKLYVQLQVDKEQ